MLVLEKLPFFVASVALVAITYWAQSQGGAMAFGQRLPLAYRLGAVPVNYLTYLWHSIWPIGLAAFYRHPGASLPLWEAVASAAILVGLSIAVWRQRTSQPT